ncbi:hypothetical protein [Paludisphaera mucosa]|uniref:Uncharacterized protein n=1 Tax=Paludisphaera mucosa TaxID=3030827 RepID=A0ABT6F5H5_9BACT|nr:hypothetical protein [Paludisphaera mucosa]MDG3002836.1 hypothetical protein [Paludisphaera mucosa]
MLRSSFVKRIVPSLALAATALFAIAIGPLGVSAALAQAASAPFVFGFGPQGLNYYAAPGVAAAPVAAPRLTVPTQTRAATSSGSRSVGPGARNWATGNRVPSHRPWLRSRS